MSQNYRGRSVRNNGQSGHFNSHSNNRRSGGNNRKKQYIDPIKFVKKANPQKERTVYVPENSFADLNINDIIKKNLSNMNFSSMSPIQDKAIPLGLSGRDILGIANTGTGKTAAFAIPLINRLIAEPDSKAIILAPTRELAEQIEEQCHAIGRNSGLNCALLIGGVAMQPQLRELYSNPRAIIGTPGRVKDHVNRGTLNLSNCNVVVLDEVDRLLDMGFISDIKDIVERTNENRQNMFFSATMDNKVKGIIESFANNPAVISVKSEDTSDLVEQNIVTYSHEGSKMDKLQDILIQETTLKTIIFDDTHHTVEDIAKELASRGFLVDSIHGGKSQSQRQRVLKNFKENRINVLVATDVAARGLDVSDITHVINYSLPQSYDDYIHRIGRTGRAGKVGCALTFVKR